MSRNILLSSLLSVEILRRFAIEDYTNQSNFSLTDAFLGQSRGVKFGKFSLASDPTMVGSPMSQTEALNPPTTLP